MAPFPALRRPAALFAGCLVLALGFTTLPAPAAAQDLSDAVIPYVNASDLRDIAADGAGTLWIASNGGALSYDLATGAWVQHPRLLGTGPRGNDLVTVAIDHLGLVWVGSITRGFTFYDPAADHWDRLSEEWPDPRIRVIRALGTGVYIGTQEGLSLKPTANRTDICAPASPSCIVPSYVVNDYALMQDTLWVATQEGLGRFNGEAWDTAGAPGLPPDGYESRSLAVFEGTLWEAHSGGVRRLGGTGWENFSLDSERLVVSAGSLYSISGQTVTQWSASTSEWVQLVLPSDTYERIRDLERVGGDFYLATENGLVRARPGQETLLVPPGPALTDPYAGIAVDGAGTVWAGTQGDRVGLVRFDGDDWSLFTGGDGLTDEWVWNVLSDRSNRIWVAHCCCPDPGCSTDVRIPDEFLQLPFTHDVFDLDEDRSGRVWAGTDGFGVQVLEESGEDAWDVTLDLTVANTSAALASDLVRAVGTTDGGTYFGHFFNGLDYWPHGGNLGHGSDGSNWTHITTGSFGLYDKNVSSIVTVGEDVWVGTSSGIHRFRGGNLVARCPTKDRDDPDDQPRKVNALTVDRDRGLWVGTENGLLYLPAGGDCSGNGGDFTVLDVDRSALPDNDIRSAGLSPADGSVWVGTSAGIARVDPSAFTEPVASSDQYILYPNPFPAVETGARVHLAVETGDGQIRQVSAEAASQPEIFSVTGRKVGMFEAFEGSWVWLGKNLNGDRAAPGLYLVRFRPVGRDVVVLKMGVVR